MQLNTVSRHLLSAMAVLSITAGSVAANASANANASDRYTLVDLGTLGGSFSSPSDINNSRQIVGSSSRNDKLECAGFEDDVVCEYAFLWQNGKLTDLGHLNPSATSTQPNSINDNGVIAGTEKTLATFPDAGSALQSRPFIYRRGVFSSLPLLWKDITADGLANSINGAGAITGFSRDKSGQQVLVKWTRGKVERSPVESAIYARRGEGINLAGTIVGWQYEPVSFKPSNGFVLEGSLLTNLSADDENLWSEAMDINNAGLVVGNKADAAFQFGQATTWSRINGQWIAKRIGSLKGHTDSSLNRVNKYGDSVGSSNDANIAGSERAIALLNGRLVDLTAMLHLKNIVLNRATGINDNGDIVVEATPIDNIQGPRHAYVLLRN